jgi:hypothetical protein
VKNYSTSKLKSIAAIAAFTSVAASLALQAQDPVELDPTRAQEEAAGIVDTSDKSGTNPVNFTFDARIYNEYQWLKPGGDIWNNVSTFEFRIPFADDKWQVRTRLRYSAFDVGVASESGFGDMDFRFLTVPIMNAEKRFALALGSEFFLPTGSGALSNGAYSLGPQIFLAKFAPFNGLVDLIAPGYQHQFSVYEKDGARDVNLGIIDLFILKTFNDKKQWMMLNPQGIMNYETNQYWTQFDIELGTMLKPAGHSVYIRPSIGIGSDSPYDISLEAGYKIIW